MHRPRTAHVRGVGDAPLRGEIDLLLQLEFEFKGNFGETSLSLTGGFVPVSLGPSCCTPTVNHRPASPDKAQKQALAPLAWALTALALVYRLYRLHTRQKYEQQEPVWPPAALRTAPGAQPLHALRGRGGRLSPLGEASSAARAGKAARIHPCPPRGLASAAQKWPASVRPALVSVRDGRNSLLPVLPLVS